EDLEEVLQLVAFAELALEVQLPVADLLEQELHLVDRPHDFVREVDAKKADEHDEQREASDEREHHRRLLLLRGAPLSLERILLLVQLVVEMLRLGVERLPKLRSVAVLLLDLHADEVAVLLALDDERLALLDDLLALLGDLVARAVEEDAHQRADEERDED